MKKNILIIFIILVFVITAFGKPPNRRAHDNIYSKFITQKLALLGLKAGKINKVGNNYIVMVTGFLQRTNALKLTRSFKPFSLKVKLQGIKPDLNTRMGIIMEDKNPKPVNKNLKILIKKETLLGANFIVDDNDMPAGIIIQRKN